MSDKTVLITGGTKGIGLATALQFAEAGAQVYLTYKWGSADQEEIFKKFEKIEAKKPILLEADVSVSDDTDELLTEIKKTSDSIDIFISNVGFALRTPQLDDYEKRSLYKTLDYSTWPIIDYTRKIKEIFGKYPEHVVGISSDGPDHYYQGYDFVAASKALLEFFGKYLSVHLFKEGSRVNIMRFGTVDTESFSIIFGEDFFDYLKENGIPDTMVLQPEDCGKAIFALCSGYLNAINGQIITADLGATLHDNMMMRYIAWKENKNNN